MSSQCCPFISSCSYVYTKLVALDLGNKEVSTIDEKCHAFCMKPAVTVGDVTSRCAHLSLSKL